MKLILKIAAGVLLALVLFSIPFIVRSYREDQQRRATDELQNSITAQNLANLDALRSVDLQGDWVGYSCDKHPQSTKCSDLQNQLDTIRADMKQKIEFCNEDNREFNKRAGLAAPKQPMCAVRQHN